MSDNKIKEYFPSEHVQLATMEIYKELLGLDFNRVPAAEVWHEDVSCFQVLDSKTKKLMGHFYLDLYPREGKFTHAAAFALIKRAKIDDKVIEPAVAMVTNFN